MGSIRKAALVLGATGALLFAGAGAASADASAVGAAFNSPGVLSGNVVQIPIDIPINICGNSVNVVGLLNPAIGNTCSNGGGPQQHPTWHHEMWSPSWHHHAWMHQDDDCDGR
jgi:hypothetical protein